MLTGYRSSVFRGNATHDGQYKQIGLSLRLPVVWSGCPFLPPILCLLVTLLIPLKSCCRSRRPSCSWIRLEAHWAWRQPCSLDAGRITPPGECPLEGQGPVSNRKNGGQLSGPFQPSVHPLKVFICPFPNLCLPQEHRRGPLLLQHIGVGPRHPPPRLARPSCLLRTGMESSMHQPELQLSWLRLRNSFIARCTDRPRTNSISQLGHDTALPVKLVSVDVPIPAGIPPPTTLVPKTSAAWQN